MITMAAATAATHPPKRIVALPRWQRRQQLYRSSCRTTVILLLLLTISSISTRTTRAFPMIPSVQPQQQHRHPPRMVTHKVPSSSSSSLRYYSSPTLMQYAEEAEEELTSRGYYVSSLARYSSSHQKSQPYQSRTTKRNRMVVRLYNQQLPNNNMDITNDTIPEVYPQRWTQLVYLSLLALMSDWICFSVAAAPDTYESIYGQYSSAASLIDLFLFTNVASCFLVTDIVDKIGLQRSIQAAAVLMTIGCWLRSGVSGGSMLFGLLLPHSLDATTATAITPIPTMVVPYSCIVAGTVLVGFAQPFFQCTPPLLSATWFAASERATATAVALNFNQIGIATAFLVGGAMLTGGNDHQNGVGQLATYFGLISGLCTMVTIGTLVQFQNEPPVPPSRSELDKKLTNEKEPPFITSVQRLLSTKGFTMPLAAFVCSIAMTNIVGTFIDDLMERGGVTQQLHIDIAGAAFEIAILLGGIVIGGYVDQTKDYKRTTLWCLAVAALMVLPLGWTDNALGPSPILVTTALLGLGLSAGPIQPINAELAVDVTYPSDETAVESVQQIFGNMVSALLIPVAEYASRTDWSILSSIPVLASHVRGDAVLLCGVALTTLLYFNTFDAPLARTMADSAGDTNDNDHDSNNSDTDGVGVVVEVPPPPTTATNTLST